MPCFGFIRVAEALDDLDGDLVGAAVFITAQRADRPGDRGVHIRAGAGDDPRGEGGGIEFVLGVQHQRDIQRAHVRWQRIAALQQVQEMTGDRILVGLDLDPARRCARTGTSRSASRGRMPAGGRRCCARPAPGDPRVRAARCPSPNRRCAAHPSAGRPWGSVPEPLSTGAGRPRMASSFWW